jgi:hypothetical protein
MSRVDVASLTPRRGLALIARCLVGRVRQLEGNLGIKANAERAESLVADLRVGPPDDHRPTGGAVEFTRAQSGQKLQRRGVVQIANGLVPDPHCYRIRAACGGRLRDQQCRTTMASFRCRRWRRQSRWAWLCGGPNVGFSLIADASLHCREPPQWATSVGFGPLATVPLTGLDYGR